MTGRAPPARRIERMTEVCGPARRAASVSRRALLTWGAMFGAFGPGRLAAKADQNLVTLGDSQGFTKDAYTAFMAPYNKGALRAGVDYRESISLDPALFPARTTISWTWPEARADASVRGFLAVDYGNYYNTVPARPIRSRRVSDIRTLTCDFDLAIDGTLSGFDVVVDFFLTSTPDFGSILFEIEIFLHAPRYVLGYADSTRPVGMFRSTSGSTWTVSKDPVGNQAPIVLFHLAPGHDVLDGSIDIAEMLHWLKDRGVLAGTEFFNGLALGVEPQQHDGILTINTLSVDYVSANDPQP